MIRRRRTNLQIIDNVRTSRPKGGGGVDEFTEIGKIMNNQKQI